MYCVYLAADYGLDAVIFHSPSSNYFEYHTDFSNTSCQLRNEKTVWSGRKIVNKKFSIILYGNR